MDGGDGDGVTALGTGGEKTGVGAGVFGAGGGGLGAFMVGAGEGVTTPGEGGGEAAGGGDSGGDGGGDAFGAGFGATTGPGDGKTIHVTVCLCNSRNECKQQPYCAKSSIHSNCSPQSNSLHSEKFVLTLINKLYLLSDTYTH